MTLKAFNPGINSRSTCDFFRPLICLLPFGGVAVLRFLGGAKADGSLWKNNTQYRVFYDRLLQAYVWSDMADWSGRWHYYTGKFYDKKNQFLILTYLREGDVFIDAGANVGMHTILASRVVGSSGQVHSFEPQSQLAKVIQAQLVLNNIKNVSFHQVGLSDESTELTLRNQLSHHGTASFRLNPGQGEELLTIQIVRAESLLPDLTKQRVLIKVDVEGFEYKVIKGFGDLLEKPNIALSVEVTDEWLRETGSSAADLYSYLRGLGFEAHTFSIDKFGKTKFESIDTIPDRQHDAFFVKPKFIS